MTGDRRRAPSLARQLFVLQLVVLAVVVLAGAVLALLDARRDGQDAARQQVLGIAESLAEAPSTAAAITGPDPSSTLQPTAEAVRRVTGVDFVVVMAPDRTRFSHPVPERIGELFVGTTAPALAGRVFTEVYPGTLGPSIRAVAPVRDTAGTVVGLVAVGITQQALGRALVAQLPLLLTVVALALLLAAGGSLLLSRRLRRQTLGLGTEELRATYVHQEAVLHALGEGLVVVDPQGAVTLVNDEARRLLALGPGDVELSALPPSLAQLVDAGAPVSDELHLAGDRVLLVSLVPATWEGRSLGAVLTLRDHTELQGVLGELDSVRGFAESLRSQAHESANRLHTIITMVELGRTDEAVAFGTAELELSQHLVDRLVAAVEEPALAALLLGKIAQAAERGVRLDVSVDTALTADTGLDPRELLTVVGNLLDNACDAALGSGGGSGGSGQGESGSGQGEAWVEVSVRQVEGTLVVSVADSGPGLDPAGLAAATERGRSSKAGHHGLGLALVAQVVARHGGALRAENAEVSMLTVEIPLARTEVVPA